ncbi:MAG: 1-deoxy-D-xylulose-5-phosphate synthase, partial [Acetatifactor sp.]|nr:1-deoxy-D-xylulose-5-phosphate synthase [Acetatifactor sp.]
PRGTAYSGLKEFRAPVEYGKAEWIYRESEIALFAVGCMVKTAETVRERLKEMGHCVSLVNARFVKPIDEAAVLEAASGHRLIVTMEENVASGGYGEKVLSCLHENHIMPTDCDCIRVTLPDAYIEHGNVELLREEIGVDAASIVKRIVEAL